MYLTSELEFFIVKIDIYTSPLCGFCTIAKNLLLKKGVKFTEHDILNDPSLKPVMLYRANGAHTVPQIFINDHHIGGWDALFSLEQAGKLDKVLMAK